ncbi:hypothetical protein [Tsuneonella amylolytica]|uniref:hypothetical protein n=1 Tax=Tsuneonella amylolytica TaxID=2338327 RepID=UPI0013C42600|nr:hypothetical protein [Tsuneonella amylolytica]
MNDYRMPLFSRYDMSVIFDHRVAWIQKRLREGWGDYCGLTDAEVVSRFCEFETISALQLDREDFNLERVGKGRYELEVSFCGDDELWQLYPVAALSRFDGEVFRLKLILQALTDSREKAQCIFNADLEGIEVVLDQQQKRIEVFENALPGILTGEVAKLRYYHSGSRSYLMH